MKTAAAHVSKIRQTTQYSCCAASIASAISAFPSKNISEDDVNKVLGASPMSGASWESMLATLQYFGMRGSLVIPATPRMLKEWTDKGLPVLIGWNPEGRPWSHASVVFDVTEGPDGLMIHVMDPNIPNPSKTVRVVPEDEFCQKWSEKMNDKLIMRRPACVVELEVTAEGRQVRASARKETRMAKKQDTVTQRDYNAKALKERGGVGGGSHKNKQDYDRGHARSPKHKNQDETRSREAGEKLAAAGPRAPKGKFLVDVSSGPNIDFRPGIGVRDVPAKIDFAVARTLAEAPKVFLNSYVGLGSGNSRPNTGKVYDDTGKVVAFVSYNGRLWHVDAAGNYTRQEMKLAAMDLTLAEGCPDNLDDSECAEWESNTDKYQDKFKTASLPDDTVKAVKSMLISLGWTFDTYRELDLSFVDAFGMSLLRMNSAGVDKILRMPDLQFRFSVLQDNLNVDGERALAKSLEPLIRRLGQQDDYGQFSGRRASASPESFRPTAVARVVQAHLATKRNSA